MWKEAKSPAKTKAKVTKWDGLAGPDVPAPPR